MATAQSRTRALQQVFKRELRIVGFGRCVGASFGVFAETTVEGFEDGWEMKADEARREADGRDAPFAR